MCLPKKVTKNKNKNHSMGLNADYKLAQHTCSSWYSGRRCAACLVWPVLVVASSVVQPPVQLRPSDQQDAWRPERTSNPVMETYTHTQKHIHFASLLCRFIISMFRMGFTWFLLWIRCKNTLSCRRHFGQLDHLKTQLDCFYSNGKFTIWLFIEKEPLKWNWLMFFSVRECC